MDSKDCPYYPCHHFPPGVIRDREAFCSGCFCSKYPCGDDSKGLLLMNGLWDCSYCIDPHVKKNLTQKKRKRIM